MRSKYKLPKKYLSYSAISLWQKDKDAFRQRYYYNEPFIDNVYTLFGREVHESLETKQNLAHIPRYSVSEMPIKIDIEGVPIIGYIDSFSPKSRSFLDFKTSTRLPDGSARWNLVEVQKLMQLPFYSFLIEQKHGRVHPWCKLIWLETQFKASKEMVGSRIMEGEGNELELTGHYEVFRREIEPWERVRIKEIILESANEISKDYAKYTKK